MQLVKDFRVLFGNTQQRNCWALRLSTPLLPILEGPDAHSHEACKG